MSPRARIVAGVVLLFAVAAALAVWGERSLRPRLAETRAALVGSWEITPWYGNTAGEGDPCRVDVADAEAEGGDLTATVWRLRSGNAESAETLPLRPAPFDARSFEGGAWRITRDGPDGIALYALGRGSVFEPASPEFTGHRRP